MQTNIFPLRDVAPYINWAYFFNAWKVPGQYSGIEHVCACPSCTEAWLRGFSIDSRDKAREALRLLRDAQQLLQRIAADNLCTLHALYTFLPAHAVPGGILCTLPDASTWLLPCLRQQNQQADGVCLSLADFVSPIADEIGIFSVSVAQRQPTNLDVYEQLLWQTVCDRLAEATSEYLHQYLLQGQGIRPAIGYPSLPDQSLMFDVDHLMNLAQIGIHVTECGAMSPTASECGFYIKHPQARYFRVDAVSETQLTAYAAMRKMTLAELRPFVSCTVVEG